MIRSSVRPLFLGLACGVAALTFVAAASTGPGPAAWVDNLSPIVAADWGYDRAAHLIERAGFGATPEEIERLASLTPQQAVARLVNYDAIDNSALKPSTSRTSGTGVSIPSRQAGRKRCGLLANVGKGSARKCCRPARSGDSSRSSTSFSTACTRTRSKRSASACGGRTACSRRRVRSKRSSRCSGTGTSPADGSKDHDYRMMLQQNRDAARQRIGPSAGSVDRDPQGSRDAGLSRQR